MAATLVHRLVIGVSVVAGAALAPAAVASAEVIVPFHLDPAPFGNPNGSFDLPAVDCVAITGERPGVAVVTDGRGLGCYLVSEVRWLNLSTGSTGVARMPDGLQRARREAVLQTGVGQVVVVAVPVYGTTVPGFTTVYVS